jgi:hypothetical protein
MSLLVLCCAVLDGLDYFSCEGLPGSFPTCKASEVAAGGAGMARWCEC